MYTVVLLIHSWIRWIALVAVVGTALAAVRNQVEGERSTADRWGLLAMMMLDIQMLLGLLLYLVLSPFTTQAMQDFSAAMQNPGLRFWAVEHAASMFGAVVLAHVGRVLTQKARTAASKRTRVLVCFGLAMVLILLAMPWPGTPNGRPLFRV